MKKQESIAEKIATKRTCNIAPEERCNALDNYNFIVLSIQFQLRNLKINCLLSPFKIEHKIHILAKIDRFCAAGSVDTKASVYF